MSVGPDHLSPECITKKRDDDPKLGSTSNGIFLGCLDLIRELDSFLDQHLTKYRSKGKEIHLIRRLTFVLSSWTEESCKKP
ncbi:hypothetical protein TNCV_4219411 [Trichonephila clavipes]|nr:hypothetical protein TNCV_4219411 [Trichonephila clavipes]